MAERYEIIVAGTTSPLVEAAFEDCDVSTISAGHLRLVGRFPDQAALHGVLHRLGDLRLVILEVRRIDP